MKIDEIKHYLTFRNPEDEAKFNEMIINGLFPLLEVRGRHVLRKYKFKLYCPMKSSNYGGLYSGDIYEKKQSHAINGDLGYYNNDLEVVRVIKGVAKEKVKLSISQWYLDRESPENAEYLKSISRKIY